MAKIEFNNGNINRRVLPELRNAINKVRQIEQQYQGNIVPRDFKYRSKLLQHEQNMVQYRTKLEQFEQSMMNANQVFDRILGQMEQQIRTIDHVKITRRENAVR